MCTSAYLDIAFPVAFFDGLLSQNTMWPCWLLVIFLVVSSWSNLRFHFYLSTSKPSKAFMELNRTMVQESYCCRHQHCFCDEDTVGTMKGLAKKVHKRLLELRCLMRWLLRLQTYTRHWPANMEKKGKRSGILGWLGYMTHAPFVGCHIFFLSNWM